MIECIAVGFGGFTGVGFGGFTGAVLRYLISLIPSGHPTAFPAKTLIINVIGSFLIGLIAASAQKYSINSYLILFLKVGLCGGFTTFSAFALETNELLNNGNILSALLYVLLSIILCVGAVFTAQLIIAYALNR